MGTGDGGRTTLGTTTNPGLPIIPPRCWGRLGVPHSGPQQSVKTRTVLLQGAPPFCQAPQFPRHPPNPTKQTTNPAKISWPTLHAINPQKRTIEVILRRVNTMQESIRKIVSTAGCPILAVPLFLRQGWETTKSSPSFSLPLAGCRVPHPCRALVFEARVGDHKGQPVLVVSPSTAPYPRQNVAKSVAKARKTHQVTTPQPQTYQSHSSHFPQKTPHPPLFRPKAGLNRTRNLTRSKGKTCCPRSAFDSIG